MQIEQDFSKIFSKVHATWKMRQYCILLESIFEDFFKVTNLSVGVK